MTGRATIEDAPSILNLNDKAMWVLGFNAALDREDSKWTEMLNRRVPIEQRMFDAARGKRPMPDAAELRTWALHLGTAGEKPTTGFDPEIGFILESANLAELAAYDHGCQGMIDALKRVLVGEDTGAGTSNEPWESLRRQVLALMPRAAILNAPGEVLGEGYPDWPEDLTTYEERRAFQRGVAQARAVDKAKAEKMPPAFVTEDGGKTWRIATPQTYDRTTGQDRPIEGHPDPRWMTPK